MGTTERERPQAALTRAINASIAHEATHPLGWRSPCGTCRAWRAAVHRAIEACRVPVERAPACEPAEAPDGGGRAMSGRLYSIETGTSAQTIAKMLNVLFPDAVTVCDLTFGSGKFWTANPPWRVTGIDLNPERARDVCADFTRLPFQDLAFDVCVFDPPYLAWCGPQSRMADRFSSFRNPRELREAVSRGAAEAWRVGRIGTIVKVQNYSQAHRNVRMTKWIEDVIGEEPYGEVHAASGAKMTGPHWGQQLSVYSVHTTFLAFRHGSQLHVRRAPLLGEPVRVEAPVQASLFGEAAS